MPGKNRQAGGSAAAQAMGNCNCRWAGISLIENPTEGSPLPHVRTRPNLQLQESKNLVSRLLRSGPSTGNCNCRQWGIGVDVRHCMACRGPETVSRPSSSPILVRSFHFGLGVSWTPLRAPTSPIRTRADAWLTLKGPSAFSLQEFQSPERFQKVP